MHERGYHSQHSNVNYWLGLRLTRTVGEFIDPATGKVRSLPAGEGAAGEDSDVVPL
jgi:streptogramin lyase